MAKKVIYLDNGATTRVRSEVLKVMDFINKESYGNPGSEHEMGEKARSRVLEAKKVLAGEIGANYYEIVITSGGTEANNLALQGLARASGKKKIIISSIEHSSIYESAQFLRRKGYHVVEIPVDREGFVDLRWIEEEIDSNTLIVSIIHGQNEFGTLQDIAKIGLMCRKKGVLFHTDAVQSFGKEKIDVSSMGIDLLSASAHKIGGPKGVGILYVKEGVKIEPLLFGGGQERGLRAGTENVAGIAGFARALQIQKKIKQEKIAELRDSLMSALEKIGGRINGSRNKRLSENVHVSFPGKDAEMLVLALSRQGMMCSTRSACDSKQEEENRVLRAIGLRTEESNSSIRISLSENISKKDVDFVFDKIRKHLKE